MKYCPKCGIMFVGGNICKGCGYTATPKPTPNASKKPLTKNLSAMIGLTISGLIVAGTVGFVFQNIDLFLDGGSGGSIIDEPEPIPVVYDVQYTCDVSVYNQAMGSFNSRGIISCSSGRCNSNDGALEGIVNDDGYFTGTVSMGAGALPLPITGKFSTMSEFTIKGSTETGFLSATLTCMKR